ncbi:MAG: hypothetical protein ACLP56_08260 [Candidatus Sulfotelmatobacter sp.]
MAVQLDPEFLKTEARSVALDTASEKRLFLAPEALPAVDTLVDERLPQIAETWISLDRWKGHVRHICGNVADTYLSERIRRITSANDLLNRARKVLSCYPYD